MPIYGLSEARQVEQMLAVLRGRASFNLRTLLSQTSMGRGQLKSGKGTHFEGHQGALRQGISPAHPCQLTSAENNGSRKHNKINDLPQLSRLFSDSGKKDARAEARPKTTMHYNGVTDAHVPATAPHPSHGQIMSQKTKKIQPVDFQRISWACQFVFFHHG